MSAGPRHEERSCPLLTAGVISQGDEPGGRQELGAYIAAYRKLKPDSATLRDLELMTAARPVDTYFLQQSIDRQIEELPVDYDKMGEEAGLRSGAKW